MSRHVYVRLRKNDNNETTAVTSLVLYLHAKSLYISYKSSGELFLWNRIWYLGWFWAGWQYCTVKYATFEGNFLMFSWAKKTSPRDLCSVMTLLTCSMYSACSSIMYLAYNGDSKERKKGGNNWAVKEATAPRLTIKANVAWKSSPGPSEPWVPRGNIPQHFPELKPSPCITIFRFLNLPTALLPS